MPPQAIALIMFGLFVVIFSIVLMADSGVFGNLSDKPYKDQLERVTKIIPYISQYKPSSYESDEAVVARLLTSRKYLDSWERRVAAVELLEKHDPARLQKRIAELEASLGINQPEKTQPRRPKFWGGA